MAAQHNLQQSISQWPEIYIQDECQTISRIYNIYNYRQPGHTKLKAHGRWFC